MDYLKNIANKHVKRYKSLTENQEETVPMQKNQHSAMRSPLAQFFSVGENSAPMPSQPAQSDFFKDDIKNNDAKAISFSESFNEHASITKDFAQEVIDKINVYERRFHRHLSDV